MLWWLVYSDDRNQFWTSPLSTNDKRTSWDYNVHQLFGIGGSNVSKSFPLHWRSPLFSLIEAWFWPIPTQRDGCQRANIKQLSRRPKCRQCLSIYGNNDLRIPCLYTQPRHNQQLFLFFYAWASISIPNISKLIKDVSFVPCHVASAWKMKEFASFLPKWKFQAIQL